MAPSLGSRRLICFYCGRRSLLRQDGSVREWKCGNCEAVNHLDENGEITDPPVPITEEVSRAVLYVRTSESPSSSPPPANADPSLFCNDCLKNQHLVRSSLAQYVPEEKDTMAVDRNYLKYKESLEKRYPQVCEDCLPGVVERLKQSSYTAKTDHLRRLLDKTRKVGTSQSPQKTWLDGFHLMGQLLWALGIFGQLFLNLSGISGQILSSLSGIQASDAPLAEPLVALGSSADSLSPIASWVLFILEFVENDETSIWSPIYWRITTPHLAKWSLLLSLTSFWWNPKFKEGYRGYHRHIEGFYEWYKYQVLLIIARGLFWSMIKYRLLDHVDQSATLSLHIFMLAFTIGVTIVARNCFKVNFGTLFAPTSPERLLPYVARKDKSKYNGDEMSQALTSILDEPSSVPAFSSTAGQADPFYDHDRPGISLNPRPASLYRSSSQYSANGANSISQSPQRDPRDVLGIPRTTPSLAEMTHDESLHYLSTGEIPPRMQSSAQDNSAQDLMEWKPQGSQHRAFQPNRAPPQSQLFNQAPVVVDKSPFWYKGLPAAPISQAHKARNPPNAPRLQAPSQEAKKNFFDRITGRHPDSAWPKETGGVVESKYRPLKARHEIEIAQQKFFLPNTSDATNGLSEMFEQAFTLKSSEVGNERESHRPPEAVRTETKRHILTVLVLLVALLGWNFSLVRPELDTMKVPLGVMIACGAIALRSAADFTKTWLKYKPSFLYAAAATLAGLQTIASGYGISEIIAGRTYCNTCRTQGALFVGLMLAQEVCLVALSGKRESST